MIISYDTNKEVLMALANFPVASPERVEILQNEENRDKVLSFGTSVVLYEGNLIRSDNPYKSLDNINIGIISRVNREGLSDGVGNLGGLAELISADDFTPLPDERKRFLLGKKDNVILQGNNPVLTGDIDIISRNNVAREVGEELADLGIETDKINMDRAKFIPLRGVIDDDYILNKWQGQGNAFVIMPRSYTLKLDEGILADVEQRAKVAKLEKKAEVKDFQKIKLTSALARFGKPSNFDGYNNGNCTEIDNVAKDRIIGDRDMDYDYHYPHEWLATWKLASDLLGNNEEKLIKLASELQKRTSHLIGFDRAIKATGQSLNDVANTLSISVEGVRDLTRSIRNQSILNQRLNKTMVRVW